MFKISNQKLNKSEINNYYLLVKTVKDVSNELLKELNPFFHSNLLKNIQFSLQYINKSM